MLPVDMTAKVMKVRDRRRWGSTVACGVDCGTKSTKMESLAEELELGASGKSFASDNGASTRTRTEIRMCFILVSPRRTVIREQERLSLEAVTRSLLSGMSRDYDGECTVGNRKKVIAVSYME